MRVTVPDPGASLLMIVVSHDVWLRSFRDELSLTAKYSIDAQESHARFRRKFSGNVALRTAQVRPIDVLLGIDLIFLQSCIAWRRLIENLCE